jgi:thiol-disulfide isomerase/thioredoxin
MRKFASIMFAVAGLLAAITATSATGGLNFKLKPLEGKKKVELAKVLETGPALIAFWATWCHPCQEELIHIQKLYQLYADSGMSFYAVSIDDAKTAGKVKAVAKGKRFTLPILLDPEQEAMRIFGLSNVPGVYILGREGKLLYQHTGYKPGDEIALEENVRTILKLAPGPTAPAVCDSISCGADSSCCPVKEDK